MPDSSSPAAAGKDGQDEALSALLRDLRAELGDFGYQWLAACAVYPRLHWHLTIYLGGELARTQHCPAPDENAHLALARLPWFRKGSMPDDLRLRLIADLGPDNRKTVRQAIKRLFHQAMTEPAGATFEMGIARSPPPGWREALRRLLARAEPDALVHDAIFVRYMMGHTQRPIDLWLNRKLAGLFGAELAGWFDRRTVAFGVLAIGASVAVWSFADTVIKPLFTRTVATKLTAPAIVAPPGGTFPKGLPEGKEERMSNESASQAETVVPPVQPANAPNNDKPAVAFEEQETNAKLGEVSSPDESRIARINNGEIELLDKANLRLLVTIRAQANDIAFSPDGWMLASAGKDGFIRLWSTQTGQEVATLVGHKASVSSVAFSPDGETIASGGGDGIRLWNAKTGQLLARLPGLTQHLEFSPDGSKLMAVKAEHIEIWDTTRAKKTASAPVILMKSLWSPWGFDTKSITFTRDGEKVRAVTPGGGTCVWNASTGQLVFDRCLTQ